MDMSKKYIRMCKKAKEIQDKWMPQLGDFYWPKRCLMIPEAVRVICSDPLRYGFFRREEIVWLPRQDQLQEIFYETTQLDYEAIVDAYDFIEHNLVSPAYVDQFTSLEQYWLAYVMSWKYKKFWDDDIGWWRDIKWLKIEQEKK